MKEQTRLKMAKLGINTSAMPGEKVALIEWVLDDKRTPSQLDLLKKVLTCLVNKKKST